MLKSSFLVYCIISFSIGIVLQLNKRFKKLSVFVISTVYILSVAITNDYILGKFSEYIKLDCNEITILVILLYAGTTMPSFVFDTVKISRLNKKMELSDYIVKKQMQKVLDKLNNDLKNYKNLFGKDFFISLYFVDGYIFKKAYRVGHSGNIPTIPSEWEGVVKWNALKHTIIGRCITQKVALMINIKELDERELDGLPLKLKEWCFDSMTSRVLIPFTENTIFNKKEVKMIITINCMSKMADWANLSYEEKEQLDNVFNKIKGEKSFFKNLLKYHKY